MKWDRSENGSVESEQGMHGLWNEKLWPSGQQMDGGSPHR